MIGLGFVILLEIIASIIIFASFSDWSSRAKGFAVIIFILTVLVLTNFIRRARNLRNAINSYLARYATDQTGRLDMHV